MSFIATRSGLLRWTDNTNSTRTTESSEPYVLYCANPIGPHRSGPNVGNRFGSAYKLCISQRNNVRAMNIFMRDVRIRSPTKVFAYWVSLSGESNVAAGRIPCPELGWAAFLVLPMSTSDVAVTTFHLTKYG